MRASMCSATAGHVVSTWGVCQLRGQCTASEKSPRGSPRRLKRVAMTGPTPAGSTLFSHAARFSHRDTRSPKNQTAQLPPFSNSPHHPSRPVSSGPSCKLDLQQSTSDLRRRRRSRHRHRRIHRRRSCHRLCRRLCRHRRSRRHRSRRRRRRSRRRRRRVPQ